MCVTPYALFIEPIQQLTFKFPSELFSIDSLDDDSSSGSYHDISGEEEEESSQQEESDADGDDEMEANENEIIIEDIQVPEQDDPPDLIGDHTV